jgi:nucleoside-diphosphate-sugar epimerase
MSLLVTGGNGFVMSNLARVWLERHPDEDVTILDSNRPDAQVARFLGDMKGRIRWLEVDILDRSAWHAEARALGIDRIAHGAALTPHAWTDHEGVRHDPEHEDPERLLAVNLGGTLAALALARSLPSCKRFLLVSTGSVYGDEGPERPLPEDGFVAPGSLYGISKYAAELVAHRFAALYGLPVVAVRLSSVFGPMDRVLPSRHVICAPNRLTALALRGESIRLNSPEGVGDWIDVGDVAAALALLLEAERPRILCRIISRQARRSLSGQLADLVVAAVPGANWSVDPHDPNVAGDPTRTRGQWGAYDISRMSEEFGWEPRRLEQSLRDYVSWRREYEREPDAHE